MHKFITKDINEDNGQRITLELAIDFGNGKIAWN